MEALSNLFARVRARLASRPDTEHEQALVRVVIAIVLGAYLLDLPALSLTFQGPDSFVFIAYLGISLLILGWVMASSPISHFRRCAGLVADVSTIAFSDFNATTDLSSTLGITTAVSPYIQIAVLA